MSTRNATTRRLLGAVQVAIGTAMAMRAWGSDRVLAFCGVALALVGAASIVLERRA